MRDSPVIHLGPERLTSDERWRLATRICASETFRRAARLQELLLYLVQQSLSGCPELLTESEISRNVFRRDTPAVDDNIVRASARQLRSKLTEYFEGPGRLERMRLLIPKGAYAPLFVDAPAEPASRLPAKAKSAWILSATALVALASIGVNIWFMTRSAAKRPLSLASALIEASADPIQMVTDDFAFVLMQLGSPEHRFTTEEYARRSYTNREYSPTHDSEYLKMRDLLGSRYILSLGAQATADRIVRAAGDPAKVHVKHARNMTAREFKEGAFVMFGHFPANPWSPLFEERLSIRHNFKPQEYVDTQASGGPRHYVPEKAGNNAGPAFARVAYMPNLSGKNFVLLLTGVDMVSSEAAGEFATDPARLPEILKAFGVTQARDLPYFEALLSTGAHDNAPSKIDLILARRLADAKRSPD